MELQRVKLRVGEIGVQEVFMKRRGAKNEKGCVEVVAVKSVVAVGSGWRLCLMRAEEWLAVYV